MYKQPYIINGSPFHSIDDELDKHLDLFNKEDLDIVDSSDEASKKVTTADVTDEFYVEDKRPKPPDESKWDIVYCLPFFGRPGKHTYMIKFKNEIERR